MIVAPALLLAAGCANGRVTADPSNDVFSISPGTRLIDTNCTGCNAISKQGTSAEQFTATLAGGGEAPVVWSLSGGDATSGPGSITADGQYTPPSYLTADRVDVVVTATLNSTTGAIDGHRRTDHNAGLSAAADAGERRPWAPTGRSPSPATWPKQAATPASTSRLRAPPTGSSGGLGSLGAPTCQRGSQAFTYCSVTYSSPALGLLHRGNLHRGHRRQLLLKGRGRSAAEHRRVSSNPDQPPGAVAIPIPLGSSGGNNGDYDTHGNQIVDCCSGTLGALIQDSSNRQYLLSNNHVLARSDHAGVGDAIIQPGLIDNNCTPNGDGAGNHPRWLAHRLASAQIQADQRRRGHRPGQLRRRERTRQHS